MSRGCIDQEFVDSARRATENAARMGKRAVNTAIYHNADGSRTFCWRFEDIEKPRRGRKAEPAPCPPPSMTHDPDALEADIRRRVGRGGVPRPKPVQEVLDL